MAPRWYLINTTAIDVVVVATSSGLMWRYQCAWLLFSFIVSATILSPTLMHPLLTRVAKKQCEPLIS